MTKIVHHAASQVVSEACIIWFTTVYLLAGPRDGPHSVASFTYDTIRVHSVLTFTDLAPTIDWLVIDDR